MNKFIDTERLITEVRLREPLWNISHVLYKDRDAKLKAWQEVCEALFPNFDEMTLTEQKDIARDAYTRSKAAIINTKSGSGGGAIKKKYIYYDHMRFLDKKHTVQVEDSLMADDSQTNISVPDFEPEPEPQPEPQPSTSTIFDTRVFEQKNTEPASQTSQNKKNRRITKSKRSINKEEFEFDKQMLQMFKENSTILQNDDMAFFTSLLPITNSFSISQKLTFRSEVLKIATKIHDGDNALSRPQSQSSSTTYFVTSPESYSSHSQTSNNITAQESEQLLTNIYPNMLPVMVSNSNVEQTDFSDLVVFKQN
ncbi:hypothetical protein HW555_004777 [Spodoptera exigua]|uniref:MADF domain-containing protein n=1 Tax=Spodoptera exigua TaxID=7107 RepID=A0A835G7Y6_SPOEX|nr:hypothetical protein HW555_011299 [Spodoptera exigua]KAF9409778.1 hypothetical protein HW555_010943 [Spodoptera exigua]KAF9418347.1 hypothetical protein HW555_004777 [Spodoptera exigua]